MTLEQKTNALAAHVAAGLSAQLSELCRSLSLRPRDGFEAAFNRALGMVACGDEAGAEAAVKAAYKQGALSGDVHSVVTVTHTTRLPAL